MLLRTADMLVYTNFGSMNPQLVIEVCLRVAVERQAQKWRLKTFLVLVINDSGHELRRKLLLRIGKSLS